MTDFETPEVRHALLDAVGHDVVVGVYSYRGIFDEPSSEPYRTGGQMREVMMRTEDVTECGLADGVTIIIDGTSYTARRPRPDGTGMSIVPIEAQ